MNSQNKVIRSSARIRNQSGKNNRSPDFVYEDSTGGKNYRERANSWSDLAQGHALDKNCKTEGKVKHHGSVQSGLNKSSSYSQPSIAALLWKNKQDKLRQERIDILLNDNKKEIHSLPGQLFRVETQDNLSGASDDGGAVSDWLNDTLDTQSFVSTAETPQEQCALFSSQEELNCEQIVFAAHQSVDEILSDNANIITDEQTICKSVDCASKEGNATVTLKQHKGTNRDLHTKAKETIKQGKQGEGESLTLTATSRMADSSVAETEKLEIQPGDDWKTFLTKIHQSLAKTIENSATTLRQEIKSTADTLREEFKTGLEGIASKQEELQKEIGEVKTTSATNKSDVTALRNELATCKIQLSEARGYNVKQDQMLRECKDAIESLTQRVYRDMNPKLYCRTFLRTSC